MDRVVIRIHMKIIEVHRDQHDKSLTRCPKQNWHFPSHDIKARLAYTVVYYLGSIYGKDFITVHLLDHKTQKNLTMIPYLPTLCPKPKEILAGVLFMFILYITKPNWFTVNWEKSSSFKWILSVEKSITHQNHILAQKKTQHHSIRTEWTKNCKHSYFAFSLLPEKKGTHNSHTKALQVQILKPFEWC